MNFKGKLTHAAAGATGSALLATILFLCVLLTAPLTAFGDAQPPSGAPPASLNDLEKEFLSFFVPTEGTAVALSGDRVTLDLKGSKSVRKGMRFFAYREGAPFAHPVTREPLGKMEIPLGQVEVTGIAPEGAYAKILSGNPEEIRNARVKIQQFKVKVLFYQGNLDWHVGDAYYNILKKNDRVELIDTSLDIRDIGTIGAEGKKKGADVVLALSASDDGDRLAIDQQLFWAADLQKFSEKRASVPLATLKELKYRSGSFGPKEGEALLTYTVSAGVRFVAAGDFDGKGDQKIALVSGSKVRVYRMGADLLPFAEFSVAEAQEILWVETFSPPNSRKDFLLITGKTDQRYGQETENPRVPLSEVTSFVYEYKDTRFERIAKWDFTFARQIGGDVISQAYSGREIYEGPVRKMIFDGTSFTPGEALKLPKGVGIYDFQFLRSPDGRQGTLVWNESGFLSMYNDEGVRIWMSREDNGGFLQTYQRRAVTVMTETEKWTVKDKLLDFKGEVLTPTRTPLLRNAKTLGYTRSQLRSLWWGGMSVEEKGFIDEIDGTLLDFAIVGDRVAVLSKPLLGVRAKNILKGDNPFVVVLSIYAIKGR